MKNEIRAIFYPQIQLNWELTNLAFVAEIVDRFTTPSKGPYWISYLSPIVIPVHIK